MSAIELDLVRRFPTVSVAGPDGDLAWDFDALLGDVTIGLAEAAGRERPESVAVDSWAIDYGLLDRDGRRIGQVHAYRSARTDGVMDAVCSRVGRERIYGITGIQFLAVQHRLSTRRARVTRPSTRVRTGC